MSTALITVFICLFVARFASEVCSRLKLPRVVGEILTGVLLGIPVIQSLVFSEESLSAISFIADIGIVLLFFYVGLGIDTKEFKKNFEITGFIALFSTLVPLVVGFFIMKLFFGFSLLASAIISICLAVSAQSVAVDSLDEIGALKRRIGKLLVTAGAVSDIFQLVLIAGIFAVLHTTLVQTGILQLLVSLIVFLFAVLVFKLVLIPYALRFFKEENMHVSLFGGGVLFTILMAALSEYLGFSSLLGALFAGIIVRAVMLRKKHLAVEEHHLTNMIKIISFGFFVPLFFVDVGLKTNINAIASNFQLGLLLFAIATLCYIGGAVIGTFFSRATPKEGFVIGWGLNSKGDVELVIALLALSSGIFNQNLFSAIVLMSLLTTIVSPVVFRYLLKKNKSLHYY